MITSQRRLRIAVLLLGVILVPVIALSQSENSDLGIVRVRYVTIVVRDYDEALNWYTNVLGLEKVEEGTFAPGATASDPLRVGKAAANKKAKRLACRCPAGATGRWHHSGNCQTFFSERFHPQLQSSGGQGNEVGLRGRRLPQVLRARFETRR